MRVVGGSSRGRRLVAKLPDDVRPTTDRVKESIFDILFSLGGVEDLEVVDLFCGSGALGIEALSRGAAAATFVDSSPASIAATEQNLEAVGLGDAEHRVLRANLPGWRPSGEVDLVLADPPYGFDAWDELLRGFEAATVVIESRDEPVLEAPWRVIRQKRYGTTLVTVAAVERGSA